MTNAQNTTPAVREYEAFVAGGEDKLFATEAEAIEYVNQFRGGEVRKWIEDVQVYVKYPRPTWV